MAAVKVKKQTTCTSMTRHRASLQLKLAENALAIRKNSVRSTDVDMCSRPTVTFFANTRNIVSLSNHLPIADTTVDQSGRM